MKSDSWNVVLGVQIPFIQVETRQILMTTKKSRRGIGELLEQEKKNIVLQL